MGKRLAVILVAAFVVGAGSRSAGSETLASLPPDRLAERVRAQLAFAEGLTALHPDRRAERAPLVEKARALVGSAALGAPIDARRVAEAEAEAVLAPVAAVAKTYTVHNVGHAHIDHRRSPRLPRAGRSAWLWQVQTPRPLWGEAEVALTSQAGWGSTSQPSSATGTRTNRTAATRPQGVHRFLMASARYYRPAGGADG